MSDSELAVSQSSVPDLVRTPAFEISAEDVALPRLKLGQYMSNFVQENQVPAGALFTHVGQDDPDPQVLYEAGDDEGLRFHVLDMRRGKSVSADGELVTYDYNDPDAPADAWVTYDYTVVLPDHGDDFPVKWLLTRTGRPAAQQINLVLAKAASAGPHWNVAFEVTTVQRSNDKGKYFVPRVKHVEAKEEDIELANKLAAMISPDQAAVASPGDEPAI